ncbi:DUF4241 domain-containing protein [Amycolatopsis sp. NPDC059657]|uniref:DUF4241 domain-containing protein n=1 Tax=Amycolatopsis sp. NPDC059657 TaxID=3346899 RepID=UPI00366D0C9A
MGARAKIVLGLVVAALVVVGVVSGTHQKQRAVASGDEQAEEEGPPVRRDGFDQLFRDGQVVKVGGTKAAQAKIEIVDAGPLELPTGKLVAGDPGTMEDTREHDTFFAATVPPGKYPASLAMVRMVDDPAHRRVAAAKVTVRPDPVARWEMALTPSQNPATLKRNEIFGYGVDSGTGAFLDVSVLPALRGLNGDGHGPLVTAFDRDDTLHASVRDPATGLNVIAFHSGWGDGFYGTWLGRTADGAVAQFVTDFQVINSDQS